MPEPLKMCVLGAGVIGLHVANRLRDDFPAADITLVADGFQKETTSIGAAGIFRPGFFNAANTALTDTILSDSWHYYSELLRSTEAAAAGLVELPVFCFTRGPASCVHNSCLKRLAGDYREVTARELQLCPGDWKHGVFCTTLVVDNSYHLGWLTKRLEKLGVTIKRQHIDSIDQLNSFDIVVNCTGLGAKTLIGDKKLVPVRGQVFKVRAPWIKTAFYFDFDTYIIPGVDHVTLGGCRQFESDKMEVDERDAAAIWERCVAGVPSLKRAEVLEQWVGLRPFRDPLRLEKQRLNSGAALLHCYGHGGYGVTAAPGSAQQISRMVAEVLRGDFTNPTFSSL